MAQRMSAPAGHGLLRLTALLLCACLLSQSLSAEPGKGNGKGSGEDGARGNGRESGQGSSSSLLAADRGGGRPSDPGSRSVVPGQSEGAPPKPASPGDSMRALMASSRLSPAYRERSEELLEVMEPALGAGIPPAILESRLREASTKAVPVDTALQALSRDVEHLLFLSRHVREVAWPPVAAQESFYSDAASAMRSGIGAMTLECLFHLADITSVDPVRAGASLSTVAALMKGMALSDSEAASLTCALAISRIPPKQIPGVLPLSRAWLEDGVMGESLVERLTQALRSGASLEELKRRMRP